MRNFPGIWSKMWFFFYKFSEFFGRKRPKYPSKQKKIPSKLQAFPGNEIQKFCIFSMHDSLLCVCVADKGVDILSERVAWIFYQIHHFPTAVNCVGQILITLRQISSSGILREGGWLDQLDMLIIHCWNHGKHQWQNIARIGNWQPCFPQFQQWILTLRKPDWSSWMKHL